MVKPEVKPSQVAAPLVSYFRIRRAEKPYGQLWQVEELQMRDGRVANVRKASEPDLAGSAHSRLMALVEASRK